MEKTSSLRKQHGVPPFADGICRLLSVVYGIQHNPSVKEKYEARIFVVLAP